MIDEYLIAIQLLGRALDRIQDRGYYVPHTFNHGADDYMIVDLGVAMLIEAMLESTTHSNSLC